MVPRSYPTNASGQWVVFELPSTTGRARWSGFIPVKTVSTSGKPANSYSGYMDTQKLVSTSGLREWIDYTPVFQDASASQEWMVSATGYIPTN
jgi:hypothetical protein